MTEDTAAGPRLSRRRTVRLSGLAAVGSIAALAGCGEEGPAEEDEPGSEPESEEPAEEPAQPEGDDPEDDPTNEEAGNGSG